MRRVKLGFAAGVEVEFMDREGPSSGRRVGIHVDVENTFIHKACGLGV